MNVCQTLAYHVKHRPNEYQAEMAPRSCASATPIARIPTNQPVWLPGWTPRPRPRLPRLREHPVRPYLYSRGRLPPQARHIRTSAAAWAMARAVRVAATFVGAPRQPVVGVSGRGARRRARRFVLAEDEAHLSRRSGQALFSHRNRRLWTLVGEVTGTVGFHGWCL